MEWLLPGDQDQAEWRLLSDWCRLLHQEVDLSERDESLGQGHGEQWCLADQRRKTGDPHLTLPDWYWDIERDQELSRAGCREDLPKYGDLHLGDRQRQLMTGGFGPLIGPGICTELLVMQGVSLGAPTRRRMSRWVYAQLLARYALNPAVGAQGPGTKRGSAEPASLALKHDGFGRASGGGTSLAIGNGAAEAGTYREIPRWVYSKTWVLPELVWVALGASGFPELPAGLRASTALEADRGLCRYPGMQARYGMGCTAHLELGPDFLDGALNCPSQVLACP